MRRRMRKLIGLRVADPAFDLLEELAVADDRPITSLARRLLLERLAQIVVERERQRQHQPVGAAGDTPGSNTAAAA